MAMKRIHTGLMSSLEEISVLLHSNSGMELKNETVPIASKGSNDMVSTELMLQIGKGNQSDIGKQLDSLGTPINTISILHIDKRIWVRENGLECSIIIGIDIDSGPCCVGEQTHVFDEEIIRISIN